MKKERALTARQTFIAEKLEEIMLKYLGYFREEVYQKGSGKKGKYTREREYVEFRQLLGYYLTDKMLFDFTHMEAGLFIGIDHASITHGNTTVESLVETNNRFAKYYYDILILIKNTDFSEREIQNTEKNRIN
jgi:hypothetical protein